MKAFLLLTLLSLPAQSQTPAASEKPTARYAKEIAKRYEAALDHFTNGRYSQAILEWTEILRKDPEQASAQKMIRLSRDQIDKRDKERQKAVFDLAAAGRFQDSFIAHQILLDRDPQHPVYLTLERRIDRVSEIIIQAPGGRAWRAAAKGLTGYIALEDDLQLAYNGLRYAREIDTKDDRFNKLIKLILAERPSLDEDEVTSGMKILDYKRFVGLNHIYDGKYNLAIRNFHQVLQLEIGDVISHKRMGSAYYALKRYDEAHAAWTRAIKISPTDKELHSYMAAAAEHARNMPKEVIPPAEVELSTGALEALEVLKKEEEEEAISTVERPEPGVTVFRPRSSLE
ncbi:MAG: hypothetical protein COB53_10290 [Elusimicrobia bacterium]|nr:MAG: hypothetical protein COB53_10290 [Elusimicrobiota bacterium]